MPVLRITTDGLEIPAAEGALLRDLCTDHVTSVLFGCFSARCGICRIEVLDNPQGLSAMEEMEAELLSSLSAATNERLACQCRLTGDATIAVSPSR